MRWLMFTGLLTATFAAILATGAQAGPSFCPPGLAKKSPACVPPGQAKKLGYYGVGDVVPGGYVVIADPWRYGLDPRFSYVRVGDHLLRVDPETRKVINVIGAVAALLN